MTLIEVAAVFFGSVGTWFGSWATWYYLKKQYSITAAVRLQAASFDKEEQPHSQLSNDCKTYEDRIFTCLLSLATERSIMIQRQWEPPRIFRFILGFLGVIIIFCVLVAFLVQYIFTPLFLNSTLGGLVMLGMAIASSMIAAYGFVIFVARRDRRRHDTFSSNINGVVSKYRDEIDTLMGNSMFSTTVVKSLRNRIEVQREEFHSSFNFARTFLEDCIIHALCRDIDNTDGLRTK